MSPLSLLGVALRMLPQLPDPAWRAAQIPYSVYSWTSSFAVIGGLAGATFAMLHRMPFSDFHHTLVRPGMMNGMRVTGSEVNVTYDRRLDRERRGVFCQNHVNVMDAHVATWVIPHTFCGLMLASHFKIPAYGWMMTMSNGIPVDPKAKNRTQLLTAAARDRAANGLSILAFPEAHRTLDGKTQPFRSGMFFMARDAGLPVVPIAARNMYSMKRKGRWTFTPTVVDVYVGRQYETAGLDDDGVRALAVEVQGVVDAFVQSGTLPSGAV